MNASNATLNELSWASPFPSGLSDFSYTMGWGGGWYTGGGTPHQGYLHLCSLPVPELNALQEELEPFGLVILGFPCNQFGKQEPGENSEILATLM